MELIRTKLYWLREDPTSNDYILIIREHTQGRRPREDGGRDWMDAAMVYGKPRTANHHQKLQEAGRILPQSPRGSVALMAP